MTRNRIGMLVALLFTIVALVVLSTGLSQMEFHEGSLFSSETISELKSLLVEFRIYRDSVLAVVLISALIIFVWSFLVKKKPATAPRTKRKTSLLIQILLWVIAIVLLRRQIIKRQLDLIPLSMTPVTNTSLDQSIPVVSSPIPDWLAFFISLALILLVSFFLWRIYQRRQRPTETLELLAQEAQIAMDTLEAGDDIRDVILRCYYQMVRILRVRRGIQRKQAMTPREFEQSLIELGFSEEPIGQLTQLFEAVRYGAKELGEKAERQAISCLDTIVRIGGGIS